MHEFSGGRGPWHVTYLSSRGARGRKEGREGTRGRRGLKIKYALTVGAASRARIFLKNWVKSKVTRLRV